MAADDITAKYAKAALRALADESQSANGEPGIMVGAALDALAGVVATLMSSAPDSGISAAQFAQAIQLQLDRIARPDVGTKMH